MIAIFSNFLVESQGFTDIFLFMTYDREFPVGFFNYHIYDDLMIAIISNFLVESQGFTDLFLFMTYDREFAVGFLCS